LIGPDDDPKSAFNDLKKIEGLRFDGSKCATCPRNCCIVHDPDEQYIAIREDELAEIYAAYPGAPQVRANKKGKDGRRYYTVTKKGAACAFLGIDQKCTVYAARPRYCRENPGNAYQIHGWDGVKYDLKRCPGTTYEKPVLCLNSGGIDSLVLQAYLQAQGFTPYSLFIDYGQPARERERTAAQNIAAHYGGKFYAERVTLELWKEPPFFQNAALHRIFRSIAKAYCDTLSIKMAPLLDKKKLNVVRMGKKFAAPIELSWSCQSGGDAPCGTCAKCEKRSSLLKRLAKSGSAGSKAAG
jgi:7-cyano-7-deazaguanine synthase in queuosine biosynthesis/Fe-S-cluster containining protein